MVHEPAAMDGPSIMERLFQCVQLIVDHRRNLKVLLASGDEEAAHVADDESAVGLELRGGGKSGANRKELSSEEESQLRALWKKLVRLYHPDRFAGEADTIDTYEKLTSAINRAREEGDIERALLQARRRPGRRSGKGRSHKTRLVATA